MKRWLSHPERYPHRCPWSHQDQPEDGPYLDAGLTFYAAREIDGRVMPDRRESALYISPQALIEAAALPGSPLAILPREVWNATFASEAEALVALEDARMRIAELESELAEAKDLAARAADPEAIADSLTKVFDARYAKRPGPKPKAAA